MKTESRFYRKLLLIKEIYFIDVNIDISVSTYYTLEIVVFGVQYSELCYVLYILQVIPNHTKM